KNYFWVAHRVRKMGFIPNVNDVFYDLSGDAGSTVLPVLELAPQPYPPLLGRGGTAGGTGGATAPKAETLLTARLNGAGLFYRDKLVAWLNAEQTRGWSWVRNKVKNAVLTLNDQSGSMVSLNVSEARAKTEVEYQDGQLQGRIKVEVEANLLEEQGYQDFTKEEAVKYLEEQAAARIRAEITEALRAAQKAGTDVFGFAGALHRRYPKVWRQAENNWRDEFQRLPVTIVIKAKLRRTGMTGRPLKPGGGS
ncbi:MAG: Ger(x)C family spore germination C-terminal domain-containing protein, partial [Moorella sp. (in: firmicutes)]